MAKGMDDQTLLSILRAEESNATGFYTDEVAEAQEEALRRYNADLYGDEVEGSSQVVSHDVSEVIDWATAEMVRMFTSGDDVAQFEPEEEQDEEFAKLAGVYVSYILMRDNEGRRIIHDFAQDGLLQKLGVTRADWRPSKELPPKTWEGLNSQQLMEEEANPLSEITEYEYFEVEPSEDYPDGLMHTITVVKQDAGRIIVRGVVPEYFLVSSGAKTLDQLSYDGPSYTAEKDPNKRLSSLMEEFPDEADKIKNLPKNDADDTYDQSLERFKNDLDVNGQIDVEGADPSMQTVTFLDEYVRLDYDGDGIAELRNIKRVGGVIFYNEEVDDNPFAGWCPSPMAHRLIGNALADRVLDIQKIKTVLSRAALDNIQQVVRPRIAIDDSSEENGEGAVNIDDLLDVTSNVRCNGSPHDKLMPLVVPDMSGAAFKGIEYYDQEREERTGINRQGQGLDPDALNKTASGINIIQEAGSLLKEFYGMMMATGLETLFTKILGQIVAHQDFPRRLRLRSGEWVDFNPADWNPKMNVSVHVGLNASRRDVQLNRLMLILDKQEKVMAALGPNNSMAGLGEYFNTLRKIVETSGFKSHEAFFKDPSANPEGVQPPQDPKAGEMEAKFKLKEMEIQGNLALKKETAVAELQLKRDMASAELALKKDLALMGVNSGNMTTQVNLGGDPG